MHMLAMVGNQPHTHRGSRQLHPRALWVTGHTGPQDLRTCQLVTAESWAQAWEAYLRALQPDERWRETNEEVETNEVVETENEVESDHWTRTKEVECGT